MIKIWIVIDGKYFILMNMLLIHNFDISYYSYEKSYHSNMIWVLIQQYGNVKPQIECIIMINKVNNFIECEIQIMMTA